MRCEHVRSASNKIESAPHAWFIQTHAQSDSHHYQCCFPAHYPEFLQTLCLSREMFSCALVYLSSCITKKKTAHKFSNVVDIDNWTKGKQTVADAESREPLCAVVCRILMSASGSPFLQHPYVQGHIHMMWTASATRFPINCCCLSAVGIESCLKAAGKQSHSISLLLYQSNSINQSIKFYLYSPYSQTTVRLIGL